MARALWGAGSEVLRWDRQPWIAWRLSWGRPLFASPVLKFQVSFVYGQLVNFLSFGDQRLSISPLKRQEEIPWEQGHGWGEEADEVERGI